LALRQWNGRLDPDSVGIALLSRWRTDLAKAVFSPLLRQCEQLDPDFSYRWRQQETPLRALLQTGVPALVPPEQNGGWPGFLLDTLRRSARDLKREFAVKPLAELPWQRVNTLHIQHPFSRSLPLAERLLDMPPVPGACNSFCVKVLNGQHGASERLVLSPNHPEAGILQMPGGQSGHPFSPHFRDQQPAWENGLAAPYLPGKPVHTLRLLPSRD
jgi:penicillin amidase